MAEQAYNSKFTGAQIDEAVEEVRNKNFVKSVNGQTGDVRLSASDVGAIGKGESVAEADHAALADNAGSADSAYSAYSASVLTETSGGKEVSVHYSGTGVSEANYFGAWEYSNGEEKPILRCISRVNLRKSIGTKSFFKILNTSYSYTLSNYETWAADGYSTSWNVESTEGVDVGDIVGLKCYNTTTNKNILMLGTVTAVTSSTKLTMTSIGLIEFGPIIKSGTATPTTSTLGKGEIYLKYS